jgi:UDP-N-acetylmuramate--alanine ligase
MKIRIGIIFGGFSREREISFAGGRTVYDNLNKELFDAVPVFIDSFGNFVRLDWQYIYKGSIRDFYPPVSALNENTSSNYQIYAESLGDLTFEQQEKLLNGIGHVMTSAELKNEIDFAFLCLHGPYGEDGRIQGLLEYAGIPYSGSGIFPSAFGINKSIQKKLMKSEGFDGPAYHTITKAEWKNGNAADFFEEMKKKVGFPCVVKPAHQGSSIGVRVISKESSTDFTAAVEHAFFIRRTGIDEWSSQTEIAKQNYIRILTDIREGLGMPVMMTAGSKTEKVFHPRELSEKIDAAFAAGIKFVTFEACDGESEVLIEQLIEGKEFSCIVIRNEENIPVALPPTEIRKGKELFDYRSKYLPGLSRKITPIELPYDEIQKIRNECERLFTAFNFNVYARIDGFVTKSGKIFLNDPNTTSGMMPSSFFFHQAAEIGLNPSQFLTFIIRTSLSERQYDMPDKTHIPQLLSRLDDDILQLHKNESQKIRVAVIMGGYSSERHISVESGRNVYEKLSSSITYSPVPIFLTGSDEKHVMYRIPVNLMLKDNADDIREKATHYSVHEVVKEIMNQCKAITGKYTSTQDVLSPQEISYDDLPNICDAAFIALHGRPGEDGEVQRRLDKIGIPYNGSGVESSRLTINKFETNEILRKNGFNVAGHKLVNSDEWNSDKQKVIKQITTSFRFPLIAKPVDDGCSSAVKKIKTVEELEVFGDAILRNTDELSDRQNQMLNLKPKEEFPRKKTFLVEELIEKGDAIHFLEITGGMLTRIDDHGERSYEVFESSEALSGGDVLSLEEKFLAGEGQNITPARFDREPKERQRISDLVKEDFRRAAILLNVEGYARIDAFVRVFGDGRVETIFIEVNSLPGMTPATCIFHQTAIAGYKPFDFIDRILKYGMQRTNKPVNIH